MKEINEKTITRVEVIDHGKESSPFGRVFSKWGCKSVELQVQDDGKTLKIFLT
jgi:hypothetical protein